ncbi:MULTISPECIES: glycosyltransferase [unclassified Frankia]
MRTTAVIVHWGPTAPTMDLAAQLAAIPRISEVVVVANDLRGRPDGLGEETAWLIPPGNLGFGGGFRHACDAYPATDCYLLLNNDVQLVPATVDACLELLSRPDVGIVGPTLVNADGLHPGFAGLTRVFTVPRARRTPTDHADDVPWVTGAITFIKAECHRQVPMAVRYFLYYEDVDLCHRAQAAGWRVLVSPAQAWHTGGGTVPSNGYTYYTVRNRLWFARLHGRPRQVALVTAWLLLAVLPRVAVSELVRRRGIVRVHCGLRGVVDGLARIPDIDQTLPGEPRASLWSTWTREARSVPRPRPARDRPIGPPDPAGGTDRREKAARTGELTRPG